MKNHKWLRGLLLSILAVLFLLPVQALAAGPIDLERDVSLTLSYQDGETPLAGADFSIYLAATVDESGQLTAADPFQDYPVTMTGEQDEAWQELAVTLEGYVLRDQVEPTDRGTTDAQGQLSFPSAQKRLTPGLYLVLGASQTQNGRVYEAQPFFVMLPTLEEKQNIWDYDVTAQPKHESVPAAEPVQRQVVKIWKDSGRESARPEEITVQLLRDGQVYDTVILSQENSWRYSWTGLESGHQWTVAEQDPGGGYTVRITRDGTTFFVTNTLPGTTSRLPKLPQTGQLWWPVPVLIAGGLLLIVLGLLRRRGAGHEDE